MDLIVLPAAHADLKKLPKADRERMMDALRQVADLHTQRMGYVTELAVRPTYRRACKGIWRPIYYIEDTGWSWKRSASERRHTGERDSPVHRDQRGNRDAVPH